MPVLLFMKNEVIPLAGSNLIEKTLHCYVFIDRNIHGCSRQACYVGYRAALHGCRGDVHSRSSVCDVEFVFDRRKCLFELISGRRRNPYFLKCIDGTPEVNRVYAGPIGEWTGPLKHPWLDN